MGAGDQPWRYALECGYHPNLVEDLKSMIPSRQRKWCPALRQWWFREEVIDDVLAIFEPYCDGVRHKNRRTYGSQSPGAENPHKGDYAGLSPELVAAYRTFYLLPTAPEDLIKAVYRALCKIHHPDAGGTTSQMQRINEVYDRLKSK